MTDQQLQDLKRIKSLLDNGALSQEEFNAEKDKILYGNVKTETATNKITDQELQTEDIKQDATKKRNKKWPIILVAILILVIIGAVLTLLNRKQNATPNEKSTPAVESTQSPAKNNFESAANFDRFIQNAIAAKLNPRHIEGDDYGSDNIEEYAFSPDKKYVFVLVRHEDIMSSGDFSVLLKIDNNGACEDLIHASVMGVQFNSSSIDVQTFEYDYENFDDEGFPNLVVDERRSFDYNGNRR